MTDDSSEPASDAADPWDGVPAELAAGARAYYRHFVTLIEREYLSQSKALGAFTRPDALASRVESGAALAKCALVEWDEGIDAVLDRLHGEVGATGSEE